MTDQDPTQQLTPPPEPPAATPRRRATAAPPPEPSAAPVPAARRRPRRATRRLRTRRPRRFRRAARARRRADVLPPQAAGDAVATAPVVAASAPKKRRSPLKWVVALVIVALVAVTAAAGAVLLTGALGHAVGPRLDPGRQRHLRRGPARPPRQPAGRAGQGPQRLPGLRRPGRVPDQDQRGPRPARRQGVRRQAELHGRHRAVVRRPARRQRRTPADRRPTPSSARFLALASVKDAAKATAWAATALAGDRRHLDHRDVQRRHDHGHQARRPTSASWPRRSSSPTP